MRLCSACLLGIRCRYDGMSKAHPKVLELVSKETLIPVCPEQLGGLPIPHPPSERQGSRVISRTGEDVTEKFIKGAQEALQIAQIYNASQAILKQRSPSCGCGQIYDGSFSGRVVPGDGVTAELLKKNGIDVITEEDV